MILEPNILGTKHKCFGLYRRRRLLTSRRCRRLDYHWGRGAQARSLQCVRVALPHQQIPTASEKPGEDATQIVTPLHQCFRTASQQVRAQRGKSEDLPPQRTIQGHQLLPRWKSAGSSGT